jgi:lipopolysaccharide biosynthesis glycosyltransferase
VPAQYSQYLYLDSDVQIRDSLNPLIDANVPEGRFLAANDPMTFMLGDNTSQSRELSSHIESLGLDREQSLRYFNSGVLRIHRKGWEEIGLQAWEAYRRIGGYQRFPDQDALNLVAVDKRLPMSLAWNFPVFMRNSHVQSNINPRVIHFMSSPKPWHDSRPGRGSRADPIRTRSAPTPCSPPFTRESPSESGPSTIYISEARGYRRL